MGPPDFKPLVTLFWVAVVVALLIGGCAACVGDRWLRSHTIRIESGRSEGGDRK